MSTTLTNGIIIPDNGSRNWGGDLANNWNIIDVNVGYMTDVKNKVTTLENSVAENTANIQTNASNISALQTSKQDVIEDLETIRTGASSGATAVQPSALSDYYTKSEVDTNLSSKANDSAVVHNSGDETIGGVKTFSHSKNRFYKAFDLYHSEDYKLNTNPSASAYHGVFFTGKSGWYSACLETRVGTDGSSRCNLLTRNTSEQSAAVQLTIDSSNAKALKPVTNNDMSLGDPTNKWKDIYATNATINTSDRNAKTSIKNIDDKLLNAWDNVNLVSFKFKDAVDKKGDNARTHTGYIAQNIKEELAKHGIDACNYGLFCYNSWDAQEEKSHEEERTDENGNTKTVKIIDTPARAAGETFGLRYIECLVVECAYLRKKNKELENRIAKIEANLNCKFN